MDAVDKIEELVDEIIKTICVSPLFKVCDSDGVPVEDPLIIAWSGSSRGQLSAIILDWMIASAKGIETPAES